MRLSELTYPALAERYGVQLCTGCDDGNHTDGWQGGRMLHFRERGVTRSGLRRFLMLVHDLTLWPTKVHGYHSLPRPIRTSEWIRSRNVYAYLTALLDFGIRLPGRMSAADRAQVRYLLTGPWGTIKDRADLQDSLRDLRKWAQMR